MFRIIGEMVIGFDRLSGIEPAITIYGSARVKPGDPLYETTVEIAQGLGKLGFAIVTGGGPGLMEAANKGAHLAGVTSVGLNIDLPVEQSPNRYAKLSITFNHFFARKVMLAKYATAFIAMPGGIGTLDELTEIVCLIQTHKMRPFPVILFDSSYWRVCWNGFGPRRLQGASSLRATCGSWCLRHRGGSGEGRSGLERAAGVDHLHAAHPCEAQKPAKQRLGSGENTRAKKAPSNLTTSATIPCCDVCTSSSAPWGPYTN